MSQQRKLSFLDSLYDGVMQLHGESGAEERKKERETDRKLKEKVRKGMLLTVRHQF